MTVLTLIDEQPMDTVPKEGCIFIEVTNTVTNQRYVTDAVAEHLDFRSHYRIYHAWSTSAMFKEKK